MLVIPNATSPEFVSVTVCAALVVFSACEGNVSDVDERVSVAGLNAVPLRLTVWLRRASATVNEAVTAPLTVGANVTLMLHELCAASELPHVSLSTN
jgi:D-arabinose 1-dehydrogenase-like Zn-dependent alcohol dehydrogenase